MTKAIKSDKYNEEQLTAKELLEFLHNDMEMSVFRWGRFCLRYAERDISSLIQYLKNYSGVTLTPKIVKYFTIELSKEAEKYK